MAEKQSIMESLRFGVRTEEEVAIEALFPTKEPFRMLQMITEQQPRAIIPWSVLGVFRRRYHSVVLKMFQEEHNTNKIAQERKGRLELTEVVAAVRSSRKEEED